MSCVEQPESVEVELGTALAAVARVSRERDDSVAARDVADRQIGGDSKASRAATLAAKRVDGVDA